MTTDDKKITAGLRGANWDPARLPTDVSLSTHPLRTEDGAVTSGFLFRRGGETAVVCLMHPREVLISHYLVPDILEAGVAVWVQAPRAPGNDLRLEHEIALHDVAAGMRFLRQAGYGKIALLGNSGGAGLYAFYNQQSLLNPAERLDMTAGGRPTKLRMADMPPAEALIFVSPHPGQGQILMNAIDPSVTDEADAFSSDPALDPLCPQNGFRPAPDSAAYDEAFVSRYRAAQRERVARLDARAREMIARRMAAKARVKKGATDARSRAEAVHAPPMIIWRTDADLRCFDLSLDPSDRRYGSLWGQDPYVSNWGNVGFARICSPESWLSTWSGLSSRASFALCGPAIEQPVLMIEYSGDNCVFPSDFEAIYRSIGSNEKHRVSVPGDHHGRPIEQGAENGQIQAGRILRDWIASTLK